ncbi:hypothetical protein NIES267_50930 [Calothrix parasitica NIES-267]|uniref:Uncharacterized protein n=1 Tax=Calothrix parasitica NIES-267 TaxID=1973488 RepID=A0A1Z4LWJ1_9CYAN|nr:hypothetical protein NIES267_50930 [Calothrix parasitica NIES-267]
MTQINNELDSQQKREKLKIKDYIKKTKLQLDKKEYEKALNALKKK